MTVAWCVSNCKEVIPIKGLGFLTDTFCLSICV
jgi:hypothetical protein